MPAGAARRKGSCEARYTASLAGIPIGKGTWVIDINETHYTAAASGITTGLIRVFTGGEGTSAARGIIDAGQLKSSIYASTIKTRNKTDEVRFTVDNGDVKDFKIDPPPDKDPERVPLTKDYEHGVLDPMTASLLRVPGDDNLLKPEACTRTLAVFDGRLRYDLRLGPDHELVAVDAVLVDDPPRHAQAPVRLVVLADRGAHPASAREPLRLGAPGSGRQPEPQLGPVGQAPGHERALPRGPRRVVAARDAVEVDAPDVLRHRARPCLGITARQRREGPGGLAPALVDREEGRPGRAQAHESERTPRAVAAEPAQRRERPMVPAHHDRLHRLHPQRAAARVGRDELVRRQLQRRGHRTRRTARQAGRQGRQPREPRG